MGGQYGQQKTEMCGTVIWGLTFLRQFFWRLTLLQRSQVEMKTGNCQREIYDIQQMSPAGPGLGTFIMYAS